MSYKRKLFYLTFATLSTAIVEESLPPKPNHENESDREFENLSSLLSHNEIYWITGSASGFNFNKKIETESTIPINVIAPPIYP